jgi:phosphoglycolate phosphatase
MSFPPAVRCAIFDLDGTLLNSLEDLADSANAMLRARGYPVHEVQRYRYFVGDGARTLVQRILPEPVRNDVVRVTECLDHFAHEYETRWNRKTSMYEGIPQLLGELVSRGIALAVLSNKPHAFTIQCIRALCPIAPGAAWAAILGFREGVP